MVALTITASTVVPVAATSTNAYDARPTTASVTGEQHSIETDATRGNLTATDYEVHDREVESGERLRMSVVLRGEGTGPAATDLVVTVDGERKSLGRVTVEPGDGDVVVEPTALATDDGWDVECEIGYDDEDGFYIRCTISYEWPESDDGTHDVAVNDLEPTAITIEGGDGNDGDRAPENENEQSDDDRHDEEREDTADDGDQGDADDAPEMDIGSQEPWPCFPGGPGPTFPGGPRIPCPFPIPIPV